MKAISPVRSMRSCLEAVCCLSEQSLAIARGGSTGTGVGSKVPAALEEPMSLLYDMNDCYSKLRELVPGIPQGSKVSQVEILQHVIDYIFDLQIVLEEQAKKKKGDHRQESPPAAVSEASSLPFKASELASEHRSAKDERTPCH